jgi:hypothetical protein
MSVGWLAECPGKLEMCKTVKIKQQKVPFRIGFHWHGIERKWLAVVPLLILLLAWQNNEDLFPAEQTGNG